MKSKVGLKDRKAVDRALKKLKEANTRFSGPDVVRVGLPKGSGDYPSPPGNKIGAPPTPVIMVGIVHEFGYPEKNIPERSFLREPLKTNRKKYTKIIGKLADKILADKITKKQSLQTLGEIFQGDVIERINSGITPALKNPSKKRGANPTPLHDTGHLIQSIRYQIGDK